LTRSQVLSMTVGQVERKSRTRVFGRATSTAKFSSLLGRLKHLLIFGKAQFPTTFAGKPAIYPQNLHRSLITPSD